RKRSANVAAATNVLSARKRSVSDKAPSRNGNHPLVLLKSVTIYGNLFTDTIVFQHYEKRFLCC
ncbi:hypothetical protein ACQKNB_22160, partial [Lysinibacillus xylanilyticus]|uniref:hypothetical protein n=1 Tax=Lysinibacillus xylanilyticus TaxID=582475 RepID=UPI003D08B5F3